ncbi:hypothetical protein CALVIDRAFT_336462 [Calocera viscosa TUFC12733]|uniref:Uncharacterized protein n=1 Tax=Calocera viscosa (strain TUFC12733) TaxID=1330018 RepID=A0A167HIK8_CALVF|nr:hypothetical protein CALVIDRAFT_336462 [Calocera viscosa TUFC12733]
MATVTRTEALSQVVDTVRTTSPRVQSLDADHAEPSQVPTPLPDTSCDSKPRLKPSKTPGQNHYYPPPTAKREPAQTTQPARKAPPSEQSDDSDWKEKAYDCLDVVGQWGVYTLLCPMAAVGIICCPAHFDEWWRRHMS